MFSLMLDPRFKILCLVFSLMVVNKVRQLLKNMANFFISMLLKCHYHLHPLVESKTCVVDQRVEENMSFNIFEMMNNQHK